MLDASNDGNGPGALKEFFKTIQGFVCSDYDDIITGGSTNDNKCVWCCLWIIQRFAHIVIPVIAMFTSTW